MQNPPDDDEPLSKPERLAAWRAWVASRPPQIQRAIAQFPIGSTLIHAGERLYLIGWADLHDSDEVRLIFSVVNPATDYEAANLPENKRYICSHHLKPMNPKYLE